MLLLDTIQTTKAIPVQQITSILTWGDWSGIVTIAFLIIASFYRTTSSSRKSNKELSIKLIETQTKYTEVCAMLESIKERHDARLNSHEVRIDKVEKDVENNNDKILKKLDENQNQITEIYKEFIRVYKAGK